MLFDGTADSFWDAAVAVAEYQHAAGKAMIEPEIEDLRAQISTSVAGVAFELKHGLVDQALTPHGGSWDLIVLGRHPTTTAAHCCLGRSRMLSPSGPTPPSPSSPRHGRHADQGRTDGEGWVLETSASRTAEQYDRARGNLDRHGVQFLTIASPSSCQYGAPSGRS